MIQSIQEVDKLPGDYKTEVHYIGQIVEGHDFETDIGLHCEIQLEYGENWMELPQPSNAPIQTHTSYPGDDGIHI